MKNKTEKPLNRIGSELLSISCASLILISLFSFTALAENTNSFDKTGTNDKISATLSSKITEASAAEQIPVIIILNNQSISFCTTKGRSQIEKEQKNLMDTLKNSESEKKVRNIQPMHIVNAIAAKVTPEVLASLAKRPDILKIEPDEAISVAEGQILPLKQIKSSCSRQSDAWGVDKIGAPEVWKQGITGKGITVAVVDSGIDATHPDLDDLDDNPGTNDPKVEGWVDYVNGTKSSYDDFGHGTQIAGIISGTGASGIKTGVAPGTKLIGAKVFDQYGSGYMSDAILAFEWAINNGAHVICFSGAGRHNSSFTIAIDKVVAAGVIPVVAAGNYGPDSNTIKCPGDEINSTTVGATDSSDVIDSFSSRGPVDLYGQTYIKPDVSAPGIDITSTYPGGSYELASGTSMAAPHVSGTLALMLEKNPTLTLPVLKQILESTAVDLGPPGKDNDYGSGRINAYKAVFYNSLPLSYNSLPPVANFSSDVTGGFVPLSVQFTDLSQNATGWNWDFGDSSNSIEQSPIHTYSAAGTYTVKLTVNNEVGTDTEIKTGYVNAKQVSPKLVSVFSALPPSGTAPLKVIFTDKSQGTPTSWKWNFGDGTYSKDKNPIHIYLKPGKYTVILTVENDKDSSTKTMSGYITVYNGK